MIENRSAESNSFGMKYRKMFGSLRVILLFMSICSLILIKTITVKAASDPIIHSLTDITDVNSFLYRNCPTTGDVKGLVFMVDFSDCRDYGVTQEQVLQIFNGGEDKSSNLYPYESVAAYYERSSFGKLHLSFDVYPEWYHFEEKRENYSIESDAYKDYSGLIRSVLSKFDGSIDYSNYDANKDGYIDLIYLVCAGSYETGVSGDTDWRSFVYPDGLDVGAFDGEGVIKTAFVKLSANAIIHETGHMLGLSDYYNLENCSNSIGSGAEPCMGGGLGKADMMDANAGDHNIFSKALLGWVEPKFISSDSDIYLYSVNDERACAYFITPDKNAGLNSEYYVVEYFSNEANNSKSVDAKGGAIRIFHVDARTQGMEFIYDNTYSEHKLIGLVEADGKNQIVQYYEFQGSEDFYYPGMSFGVNTSPSSDFHNGVFSGINLDVVSISDGVAHIRIHFSDGDNEEPQVINTVFPTVFDQYVKYLSTGRIYFNSNIYPCNGFDTIFCTKKGTNDSFNVGAQILENTISLFCDSQLDENSEYILTIPSGSVRDAYGNTNKQIDITLTTLPTNNSFTNTDKWDLRPVPDNMPADFDFQSAPRKVFNFSNGDLGILQWAYKKDAGSEDYLYFSPVLKVFDSNGNIILNKHYDYPIIEKAYQLYDDKVLLCNLSEFYILDRYGNLVKNELYTPERFVDCFYNFSDRGEFIDVWRSDTNIVCRIHKTGDVDRFSVAGIPNEGDLIDSFELFKDDYSGLKESDWIIYRIGETKDIPIWLDGNKRYRGGIGAGISEPGNIFSDRYSGQLYNHNSYMAVASGINDIYSGIYENTAFYPLRNLWVLTRYSESVHCIEVHELSDGGYLLDVVDDMMPLPQKHSLNSWVGPCAIRLNSNFDVMWISAMPDDMGDYICALSGDKIIIYSGIGTMVLDDSNKIPIIQHDNVSFSRNGMNFDS